MNRHNSSSRYAHFYKEFHILMTYLLVISMPNIDYSYLNVNLNKLYIWLDLMITTNI